MVAEGRIQLQDTTIRWVRLDSSLIRGVGGPHDPRLVVRVDTELFSRRKEQQLARIIHGRSLTGGGDSRNASSCLAKADCAYPVDGKAGRTGKPSIYVAFAGPVNNSG